MKQLINKKRIGDKFYMSEVIVEDKQYKDNGIKIVTSTEYRTKGESIILVKDTPTSKIILDGSNTFHVRVKALTKVIIIPILGRIDEEYDEIFINKGACVEFFNINGNWYILSSDGLKTE